MDETTGMPPPPPWGSRLGKDSKVERDQGLLRVGSRGVPGGWAPGRQACAQAGNKSLWTRLVLGLVPQIHACHPVPGTKQDTTSLKASGAEPLPHHVIA